MQTFFSNFPTIQYNGANVVNLTKNINMSANPYNSPFSFQAYTLENGERSDLVSANVYSDPYMEWLVFLSNQLVDPYQWYMDTDQFIDYIQQKYTDYNYAANKIKYYTNNWYRDNNDIDPSTYDALEPILTKFYQPVFDPANNIINYIRAPVDWNVNTNRVVQYYFSNVTLPTFTQDEIVNVQYDVNVTANGQVIFTTNTALYIQHVSGNYLPINGNINTAAFYIYGQESNNTVTISNTNQVNIVSIDTLDPLEDVFYDSVSYLDYETNLNEANKSIVVINPQYAQQISTEVTNGLAAK